jgi:hypothetical protein
MLSIDVAAILTVDTRPVPPDTSVITVAVLAGITALASAEADMAARRWTPNLLSRLGRLFSSGWPRWFFAGIMT